MLGKGREKSVIKVTSYVGKWIKKQCSQIDQLCEKMDEEECSKLRIMWGKGKEKSVLKLTSYVGKQRKKSVHIDQLCIFNIELLATLALKDWTGEE